MMYIYMNNACAYINIYSAYVDMYKSGVYISMYLSVYSVSSVYIYIYMMFVYIGGVFHSVYR